MRKLKLSVLSDAILYKMYLYAAEHGGQLTESQILKLFSVKVTSTFFKSAIKRLEENGFVYIQYPIEAANRHEISGSGIDYIQGKLELSDSAPALIREFGDDWLDEEEKRSPTPVNDDTWEPLPIEKSGPNYEQAIEATETAFNEIKGSNGYSESDPQERDTVVWALGEGLKQIKDGLPTRDQVVSMLVKPFKYISEKFTGAAMGEVAKAAVKALLDWLG